MPSSYQTPNLRLNLWNGTDRVKRQDFVDDNNIIDQKYKEMSDNITTLDRRVGANTYLQTINKNTLVDAINEVKHLAENNKPESTDTSVEEVTLYQTYWQGDRYSFESQYPFSRYDLEIEISDTASVEQYEAWCKAGVVGSSSTNSIRAFKEIPKMNIPVILKVVSKQ